MGRSFIPNLVTSLNLVCGAIAIVLTARGEVSTAVLFILLAALFDFLDGFVARLFRASSALGAQLDSLCDMVSFGLFPGFLLYTLITYSMGLTTTGFEDRSLVQVVLPFTGFLVTVFAALRLAKFNISTDQSSSFSGMPTPAMTLFLCFIPLFIENDISGKINLLFPHSALETSTNDFAFLGLALMDYRVLVVISVVLAFFMVSPIRFIAIKFKKAPIKIYLPVILLVVPILIMFLWLYYYGYVYLPMLMAMAWYIILSVTLNLIPGMYEISRRD